MRRCGKCGEHKLSEEFAWRDRALGRRNSYCYPCQRAFCKAHYAANKVEHNRHRYINQRRYYHRNREFIADYLLSHPCVDCAEADPVVLEFDHVKGEKEFDISSMVLRAYAIHRIQAELLKCEVRCANCHRRKTAKQFNWYRFGA